MDEQRAAVEFANDAFYTAFRLSDVEAMERLWAREHGVVCVHPGWQALIGREAVMESWRSILGGGHAPPIRCRQPQAFVQGDSAFVVCYEQIGDDLLVATNVFVHERGHWLLTVHQAGPCPLSPESLPAEEEPRPLQ